MTNKPREFWISSWDNDVTYAEYFVSNVDFKNLSEDDDYMSCKDKNSIHVIEYSAYEAIRNNNKELLDQRFDLMEKITRLEASLKILQRYHSGDGTVTREDVFNALSVLEGRG